MVNLIYKKTGWVILIFLIGIELKKASKSFAQHFSCGSSVTGDDEIVIQGDVTDNITDFIQKKWPEVYIAQLFNFAYISCNTGG